MIGKMIWHARRERRRRDEPQHHDTRHQTHARRGAVRVYVAGPYSANPGLCTDEAIFVADQLLRLGLAPLVPHLKRYWNARHKHTYEEWMSIDLAWVEAAEVLLRMPGASPGADREVEHARACGVPVVRGITQLQEWLIREGRR